MRHYADPNTWINYDADRIPTACGISVPTASIHRFPHYEDFLQVKAGWDDICPSCMAAQFAGERDAILAYLMPNKSRGARKIAEATIAQVCPALR